MKKFEKIVTWIQEEVRSGRMVSGEKLPSENELSQKYSLSRHTLDTCPIIRIRSKPRCRISICCYFLILSVCFINFGKIFRKTQLYKIIAGCRNIFPCKIDSRRSFIRRLKRDRRKQPIIAFIHIELRIETRNKPRCQYDDRRQNYIFYILHFHVVLMVN